MKLHKNNVYIVIIIILAFLIRFYQLTEESLWGDEFFSIKAASETSISNMWGKIKNDTHPPLYYFLLYVWFKLLGPSIFTLRFFSLIFSILALPFFYILTKQIANEKVGLVSLLLLAFSPYHLWYAQEGRMYSLLIFFEILYLLSLIRFLKFQSFSSKQKILSAIFFCITTILIMQTHFYAIFIVFFGIAFLITLIILNKDYSSIKFLILYILFSFINVIPNLLIISYRLATGKGFSEFIQLNIKTFEGIILAFVYGVFILPKSYIFFYSLLAVHLILLIKGIFDYQNDDYNKDKKLLHHSTIFLFISLITLPIIVSLYRPIEFYGQRYLIIGTIPYYILISTGIVTLYDKLRGRMKWLPIVFLIFIISANLVYTKDYFDSRQKRPFDNVVKEVLDPQFTPNSAYIIEPDYLSGCINYYMKTNYIHLTYDLNSILDYMKKMEKGQKLWVISIEAKTKDIEETIMKHLKRGKTYFYYNEDIPYLLIRLTEYSPE